jgi:fermentation-respiration switch protein FrsA (DUF1100 family)
MHRSNRDSPARCVLHRKIISGIHHEQPSGSFSAIELPWIPVRLLVRDRFDRERLATHIIIPVEIVHGTDDEVVSSSQGEMLALRFLELFARLKIARKNYYFPRDSG